MSGVYARRLCPDAVVVPPRMSAYAKASAAVFEVFRHTTPLVEGLSIDEAFLDVGGLRQLAGTPAEIAVRLRREVRQRVGGLRSPGPLELLDGSPYANICSCPAMQPSCTPTSTRSTPRSSSATIRTCAGSR